MADRRLQVFHAVARHLSFTKAAEALHMTQPAVTFQVRQLEEQFNTRLFDRTHNRISLTEAGERVYRHAGEIFELYSRMESEVRDLTGKVSGVVMIGASTTIAEYMLPALLGDFKRKFPEVALRLRVSNTDGIVSMVEDNEIDLGVVEAPVANKNLVVEVFRVDQLVAVLPPDHELAGRRSVPVTELVKYPYIAREEGSGTREVVHEYLRVAGLTPASLDVIMELGSPESIKGAVEAGMGISVLSRATLAKELKLGTLTAVELEPPLERAFSFVHQKQKFRVRAIEELLSFTRGYFETPHE
jgi:DNA-binding transcriptional LysR family regulator